MTDLISRAEAINAICEDGTKLEREGRYILLTASRKQRDADILSALPTVDAVPVVRCKDCKHNPKLEWLGCPMASLNEKQRPETAWCWKGEQKDGDEHGI